MFEGPKCCMTCWHATYIRCVNEVYCYKNGWPAPLDFICAEYSYEAPVEKFLEPLEKLTTNLRPKMVGK